MPKGEDNWRHRSKNMKCKTCMWFVEKLKDQTGDTSGSFGRCRRRSPTMAGFPAVFGTDWCGDHKLDEVKFLTTP